MFTGLIEEIGTIRRIGQTAEGASLVIGAAKILDGLEIGDSVAVSGPCLTVTALGRDNFTVFAMPETVGKTTIGAMQGGSRVNLERAMSLGDRLGGHLVSGHIDGIVSLINRKKEGGAIILTFSAEEALLRYIVPKGSVSLDGVSLTVIAVNEETFSVGIIPHTAGETTLGSAEVNSRINLEVDLIGKYVEKMLLARFKEDETKKGLSMAFLREQGYF